MLKSMDSARTGQSIVQAVGGDSRLAALWLFGSVARGSATPRSDVDIAVLRSEPVLVRTLDDLTFELEAQFARLLEHEVQVVDVETAPDDLVHRILRDGILLVERDRSRRIAFEVSSRNRYFDMAPIWKQYRSPQGAQR